MNKTRLREIIETICKIRNEGKSKREKKWCPEFELREMAENLRIPYNTVRYWYYIGGQPRNNKLKLRVADYYHVDPGYLYYFEK